MYTGERLVVSQPEMMSIATFPRRQGLATLRAFLCAKDEFIGIKDTTRDDLLAMHRIPPQLMGIIPQGSGSLGDIEKAAMVFWFNELLPLMESMKSINDMLGVEVIRFKQYALLDFLTQAKNKEPNYK